MTTVSRPPSVAAPVSARASTAATAPAAAPIRWATLSSAALTKQLNQATAGTVTTHSLAKLLTTVTKAGVPADSATLLKWMESAQSKAVSAYRSASPTEQASFIKTLNTLHFNRTVIMKWTTGGLGGHPH